jgi:hypothetical protein
LVEFNPNEPGVEKGEIEGPNGDEILSTIHLASVATDEEGKNNATKVKTAALNRISFFHSIAIENAQIIRSQFFPLNPPPGLNLSAQPGSLSLTGRPARLVVGLSAANLKMKLEQGAAPGEQNFGLLRSARQSISAVEEFMHLYHILMMLFNDSQPAVDNFIRNEEPGVPLSPDPRPNQSRMETV